MRCKQPHRLYAQAACGQLSVTHRVKPLALKRVGRGIPEVGRSRVNAGTDDLLDLDDWTNAVLPTP